MNNANAVMACVWCGAAFLRGLVVKLQPERGIQLSMRLALPRRNDEGSIPSPRIISGHCRGRAPVVLCDHVAAARGSFVGQSDGQGHGRGFIRRVGV